MPKRYVIPADEVKRLSAEAMEENIRILQALAESDRKEALEPWKRGVFILELGHEFNANIGTTSGSMLFPVETSALPTRFHHAAPVEKSFSVST
jgi:hypothetical protein